ncbi:hypothetical protein EVAR_10662_1 [Eumeta japonica]|uniref:Uncharacterized protein n=1 Tax=Eumeta variegata TaxID=151549 RepID=A0A4C1U6X6_EUMVA|nr:hypothetical protein EVAR_10662_1 [Eumeta japonica]
METMDLLQSSIQQIWSYVSATDTNQVTLPVRLRLHEMALGFDVEADLIDGRSHYTGIFTHQLCEITFNVVRNMNTTEMTVSGFVQSLSGGTRRMVYSPATNLTEVFSRFSKLNINKISKYISVHGVECLERYNWVDQRHLCAGHHGRREEQSSVPEFMLQL